MALTAQQVRQSLEAKKKKLLSVPVLADSQASTKPVEASLGEARESTETDKPATDHRALERGSGSDSRGAQNTQKDGAARLKTEGGDPNGRQSTAGQTGTKPAQSDTAATP